MGYSCHDPSALRQQIAKAKELNIGGFVVNWYGPRKEFEDQSYGLLQQAASQNNFSRTEACLSQCRRSHFTMTSP